MSKMKNIMVIMNPSSGLSDSGKFKEKIREQLSKYFEEVRIEETQRKGHACELAKEASEKRFDSICSVGGDGTLSEVLSGLLDQDFIPKILIFPSGTGNIMSKILKYNQNRDKVIDSINFDQAIPVDIGRVGNHAFGFILSIGVVPESLNEVSNEDKEKFGFMAYVANLLRHINTHKNYNLEVRVDDYVYRGKVDHVAATMTNKFSVIQIPGVESSLNDGNINVFILKDSTFLSRAKMGIDFIAGDITKSENIEFMQGKKLTIKSIDDEEIYIDLDGDKGPKLPIEVEIISGKYHIYVPKNY